MKKDKNKKRFVLSNGEVTNSYGFRVLTAGIDLERFKANPVCLNEHRNSTKNVLGTWEDIEVNGHILTATPNFDTEDEEGKEVARKVNNGTIKGCSIGIKFKYDDIQMIEDVPVIVKCELMEASFCAIPSNAASVVLYDEEEKQLTEKQVQDLCLSFKEKEEETTGQKKKNNQNEKPITMKQLVAHLQLSENAGETDILEAVKGIEAKLTASENEKAKLKAEKEALEKEKEEAEKAELNAELEAAVKDGRIDEEGKAPILEMPHQSAMKLLSSLKKRKSVSGQLKTEEAALSEYDKMSWQELDKGNHLAKLKAENPDYYRERFKKQFGKDPK